jgi:uncharacterized SAM-binding protein YcdF (DUF218 family)
MSVKDSQTVGPSMWKARSRGRYILLAVVIVLLIAAFCVFFYIGDWLVSEDPVQKADAIAVLSGAMPLRAEEAARLYGEGYAPKVWLTQSLEPAASLAAMGISYAGEDKYDIQVLVHEGVPQGAIEVLSPPIRNTADEISAILASMSAAHAQTVIIVTSKVHTRRTRILCRHLAKGRFHFIVRGASSDPFQPGRWWATTTDALDVVREVLGIFNVWAGLPLRPAK